MRTRVYVDGFNLYYGALKDTPFKWLNLVELTHQLLTAGHAVDKLNYFTARVSGASDPGAPARQHSMFGIFAQQCCSPRNFPTLFRAQQLQSQQTGK